MLTLCGFAASNYYNKVKFALLEKGIPFEEKLQWLDGSPELREKSPLGKIPFFEVGGQTLCESQVMVDYVESAYPQNPLLPKDPLAAAKVRELMKFIDLHIELVARDLYAEAFFGGKVTDETKERVHKQLKRNVAALGKLKSYLDYGTFQPIQIASIVALEGEQSVVGEIVELDHAFGKRSSLSRHAQLRIPRTQITRHLEAR